MLERVSDCEELVSPSEEASRHASNYFMYQWAAPTRSTPPSELLHLNQPGVYDLIFNLTDAQASPL